MFSIYLFKKLTEKLNAFILCMVQDRILIETQNVFTILTADHEVQFHRFTAEEIEFPRSLLLLEVLADSVRCSIIII